MVTIQITICDIQVRGDSGLGVEGDGSVEGKCTNNGVLFISLTKDQLID